MFCKPKNLVLFLTSLFSLAHAAFGYTPQYADETQTTPLRWRNKQISVAISNSFTKQNINIKTDGDVLDAIKKSFEVWEKVANIKFDVKSSDKQTISPNGKSGDGVSLITIAQTPENLLLFTGENSEVAAFTRIFFNKRGNISEADIVLNPYAQFSTDGTIGAFDLEATLTHEIGHLLGLDHSTVSGATMFENQGKNGTYSLPVFGYRTLSDDDLTGIRGLYGAEIGNEICCGTVQGKISFAKELKAKSVEIWLEETSSGKAVAAVLLNSLGKYKISGLPEGKYRIYAQDRQNTLISAQELGQLEISKDKTTIFSSQFSPVNKNFDLRFLGFNGQISDTTVLVNRGVSYIIYFAGKNMAVEDFEIGFNSPFLKVNPKSLTRHNYGDDNDVYSIEVSVDSEIPLGNYSLFYRSKNTKSDYIIGGLSVEETPNSATYQPF